MKNMVYLAIATIGALMICCDRSFESSVPDRSVVFQIGIDENTPYASELILSNEAYMNNSAVIISNQSWDIVGNDELNAPWCGLFGDQAYIQRITAGKETILFYFRIDRNPKTEDRQTTFEFTLSPSGLKRTLTVKQKQEPLMIMAKTKSLTYSAEQISGQASVYANVPTQIVLEPQSVGSWLTVTTPDGQTGDFSLNFTMAENLGTEAMKANIVIRNTDYNIADTIHVTHRAPAFPMTINNNFQIESDYLTPSTLNNVISWSNDAYAVFTRQIIEIRSAVDEELWEKIEKDNSQATTSFNLSQWVSVPENRIKYGEELIDMIVNVMLYDEDVLMALGTIQANPFFPEGGGTRSAPYKIYNYGQLNTIRLWLDKSYILMADIDLAKAINEIPQITGDTYFTGKTNFKPIGICGNAGTTADKPFTGTFDGDGRSIKNLRMESSVDDANAYGIGLFGAISGTSATQRAFVKNLTVTGYVSAAGRRFVGGIVGKMNNYADIIDCVNKADVSVVRTDAANYYYTTSVGGIVGQAGNMALGENSRAIDNNTTRITTVADVTLNRNVNYGKISVEKGQLAFGGVAGGCTGDITQCANFGTVEVDVLNSNAGHRVGGIVGHMSGARISECFNAGTIQGGWAQIGGIVGMAIPASDVTQASGMIVNCYNRGAVNYFSTGATRPAGIAGNLNGVNIYMVSNCYNSGKITVSTPATVMESGGIVGINGVAERISGCVVLNGSVTNITYPAPTGAGNAKWASANEMKEQITFDGWDFTEIWAMGTEAPYLKNNNLSPL